MPLFEAPGWDDGGTMVIPDSSTTKKRRRPSKPSDSFVNNEDPQSTDVNLDRLMKKMRLGRNNTGSSIGKIDGRKPSSATGKRAGLKRKKGGDSMMSITTEIDPASNDQMDVGESQKSQSQIHGRIKRSKRGSTLPTEAQVGGPGITPGVSESTPSIPTNATLQVDVASDQTEKKKKKKKKQKNIEIGPISDEPSNEADGKATSNPPLTSMQASMKQKLDGGKFRYINEILYKSDSKSALQMLQDEPTVFEEYHIGFRQQVLSWPTNPVTHYISLIQSSFPPKSVIADLGCGDAALAKALIHKGYNVLSFDLVSNDDYVVAADICEKVPLPGGDEGGKIVDLVLCSLSLMSTNWLGCIKEAKRILTDSGHLWIAEVTSRFKNVDTFVSVVSSLGFDLVSKEEPNTHFILFSFRSIPRGISKSKSKEWKALVKRSEGLLKPCEYKRR